MKHKKLDICVGLFVLIGMVCLFFLSLKVANLKPANTNENYTLQAEFTNIGALKIGAPIKIAGVLVGRVTQISINKQTYNAIVHLTVNKEYPLSQDASAQIFTSGLLGEQYISLSQGPSTLMLADGDEIKDTSSAFVIEELIGKFITNSSSKS
ncbi:MAG: outer membrane lipid asymmetry maintenance protein MlaD [Neisseriaceae bacterium]|nr:outer membrane lipid asymmetry maintenance protein MlaD [Neisseriaceae bacterium]